MFSSVVFSLLIGAAAPTEVTTESMAPSTAPTDLVVPEVERPEETPAGDEFDNLLDLSMQEKEDLSVAAASKYVQRARKTPANVVIISRNEIQSHQYRTLPQVLSGVAGMFTSNDGMYDFLNVRGFGLLYDLNTRILVLLDGRPLNAGIGTGGVQDFHVDLDSVERIEVIKGPGGSIYGTGAFFAVVNVITVDPESPDADEVAVRAGAPIVSGEGMASNGGKAGDVRWFVTGNAKRDEGEDHYFWQYDPSRADASDRAANGGVSEQDRLDEGGAYGRVAWKGLSFSLYGASRQKHMPDAEFESDFNSFTNRYLDQRYFAEAAYQGETGPVRVLARLFGDYADWQDGLRYTGYGLYRDQVSDRFAGAEARTVWKLPARNTLLTGVEVSRHVASLPSGFLADFKDQQKNGKEFWYTSTLVYAQDDWQASRYFLFSGGLQANLNTLYKPAFLPRLAAVITPAEAHTIKAIYGQGIRQPTVYERFFQDFNSYLANDKLGPEIIHTTELSYETYPADWLRTQASVYYNWYDQLIIDQQVEVGPDDFRSQFHNAPGFRSQGVELTVGAELPRDWKGEINGAAQDVRSETTDSRAENSPTFVSSLLLSGPVVSEKVVLAADWHFVSKRSLADRSVEVADYHVGNLALRYSPWKPISLGARVMNVLDRKYDDLASSDHDPLTTYPQRGRTGLFQVVYNY